MINHKSVVPLNCFTTQSQLFMTLTVKAFENVRKGENADHQHSKGLFSRSLKVGIVLERVKVKQDTVFKHLLPVIKDLSPFVFRTFFVCVLTHSLIHNFETFPNSKKLQMTTEIWLLNNFKIQIAQKTLWKKVKLLTFFHIVFLKRFSSLC